MKILVVVKSKLKIFKLFAKILGFEIHVIKSDVIKDKFIYIDGFDMVLIDTLIDRYKCNLIYTTIREHSKVPVELLEQSATVLNILALLKFRMTRINI